MKPNGLQCANAAFVNVVAPEDVGTEDEKTTPYCRLDLNWLVGSLKPELIKQYNFWIIDPENQSDLDNILNMHIDPITWTDKKLGNS